MSLAVERVISGRLRQNSYVVHGAGEAALLVDPGDAEAEISAYLDARGLSVVAILGTHAHFDHVGSVSAFARGHDAPYCLSGEDARILRGANILKHIVDPGRPIDLPEIDRDLRDGPDRLVLGDYRVEVIATPGHTPGGSCFLIDGYLFTGDTLLRVDIGRTDLPGGDPPALARSLRSLAVLPCDLTVQPGHGRPFSLGEALEENPGLRRYAGRA